MTKIITNNPLMEKYEEETGKLAIWKGELTKMFSDNLFKNHLFS